MHITVLSSSLLSALVLVDGALGNIVVGGLSDSFRSNRLLLISVSATLVSYAIFFASFGFVLEFAGALSMGFFNGSIFPTMQSLMADSSGGRTGSALGLSTSAQSVATIFSSVVAALLFTLGVGRALALDAMIPAALAALVALALRETRGK